MSPCPLRFPRVVILALGLVAASATPSKKVPTRFLGNKGSVKEKVSLVKQNAHDPGYNRNWGVRGATEDDFNNIRAIEREYDNTLDRSVWEGDSMEYDFRVLDDFTPVAPMDRLHTLPAQIKNPDDAIQEITGFDPGGFRSAAHIPDYLYPMTFPKVVGKGCNCTLPLKPGVTTTTIAPPAPGTLQAAMFNWNKNWGRLTDVQKKAAQALGWKEDTWQEAKVPDSSQKQWQALTANEQAAAAQFGWTQGAWYQRWANLVTRQDPDFEKNLKKARQTAAEWPDASHKIECVCGKAGTHDQYTWFRTEAKSDGKFSLMPADTTYRQGDYWSPDPRSGLHAPADRLPWRNYPNQAPADHVWRVPVQAPEDQIAYKYARYIDQVSDKSLECDSVSEECTIDCVPGDDVEFHDGNTKINAKVTKAYVGNALEVQFAPESSMSGGVDCPLQAQCSPFRYCLPNNPAMPCKAMNDKDSKNWAGMLVRKHECPSDSQKCKTIAMTVAGTHAKKAGKTCKANFKKVSPTR